MSARLFAAVLAAFWTTGAFGQITDPTKQLKPADDRKYERKGSLFWNLETEEDWAKRLLDAPLGIAKVFVRWKADEQRNSDVTVVICFGRRLQEVERTRWRAGKTLAAEVVFRDGTTLRTDIDASSSDLDGTLKERCVTIGEGGWHPAMRRHDVVSVPHEKRFRAENVSKVVVKVQRPTKYSGTAEQVSEGTEIIAYTEPTRKIYKSAHGRPEVLPVTKDYVRGRILGEALYFVRKCPGLSLSSPFEPPAETDTSEYAQGFAKGWELAGRFASRQTAACSAIAEILEIKQSGIANPIAE